MKRFSLWLVLFGLLLSLLAGCGHAPQGRLPKLPEDKTVMLSICEEEQYSQKYLYTKKELQSLNKALAQASVQPVDDWTLPEDRAELRFDEAGLAILAGGNEDAVPYGKMTAVYETERLWLLLCGGEQAILLQKKDLTKGDAAEFAPCLREKITKK